MMSHGLDTAHAGFIVSGQDAARRRKHYISNQQTRLIRKQDYLKNLHPGKEAELEDSETGSCSSTSSSAGDTDSNSETA